MKLACDLDSRGGFVAADNLSAIQYGWLELPQTARKGESFAGFWLRRVDRLVTILRTHNPKIVAFEVSDWHRGVPPDAPIGARLAIEAQNRTVARGLGRLELAMICACRIAGIADANIIIAPVHDVKKVVCRNGNAPKQKILDFARLRFPNLLDWGNPKSQTIADALSVLVWLLSKADPLVMMRREDVQ